MYLSVDFLKADIIFRRLLTYILFALHYMLIRNRNPTINHVTLHASKIAHVRNGITHDPRKNSMRELSNAWILSSFAVSKECNNKFKNLD